MNKNGITTALAVMAFAGVIVQGVAPQNTTDLSLNNGASVQSMIEPNPAVDTATATTMLAPAPAAAPASDSLLSEVKVYPSF